MSRAKLEILGIVLPAVAVPAAIIGSVWQYLASRPTTYCTKWTRAISIESTNSDNGKHADEQYVVRYEDGSIDGQDQGKIPFARCTNKVEVHASKSKPNWKIVDGYHGVDWEQ